ncbi:bacillithiol biosynthesis cysteine-adding enzyme BshC [Bacillus suaedae]|uniref:Putative cysteine ligase BshC n=1 Tax=Halalkalibacter suaedae TaxID=2822140 RepID=A0A941ANX5_9BACI|nr:bacillithiol biosynthesis cysteine-adding enzyme BshC [Bacillus suaedae]MBP3952135.1 bacillithiol biosynthesis cysteine-adding enzyme BshC [Bacillus suaedae]
MEVREIDLSTNGFINDYINGKKETLSFFDYSIGEQHSFKKRVDDLYGREYQREALVRYFSEVHQSLPYYEQSSKQIMKLKQANSVVVVGGQQAGLLTGPLYTVYKAISILAFAKQQEEKLKVPVVPVFWIAGEDHDLDEIRFVYKEKAASWKKHMYEGKSRPTSASNVELDQKEIQIWLNDVFSTLPETAYTNNLVQKVTEFLKEARTFVDFFTYLMNWFFGKEGLLLLDAHHPSVRELEKGYFKQLIIEVESVQKKQLQGLEEFVNAGYEEPLASERTNAHLFIDMNGERKRLEFENDVFFIKGTNTTFSKEELLEHLDHHPELFSNNVATRPLMQEWLLPVLAFISGPGEIKYWATLKHVFRLFDMKVPPVVPRYQMTFIPTHVQKWLAETNYSVNHFIEGEMGILRERWLEGVNEYPIREVMINAKQEIQEKHATICELTKQMDPTLSKLSEKNWLIIENQLSFIEKKMNNFVRQSHEETLTKFTESGRWLCPLNYPQERIIHPILLINVIGEEQYQQLMSINLEFNQRHKLIFL